MNALTPPRRLRVAIFAVIGLLWAVPVVAMAEFTLRRRDGGHDLAHWADLLHPAKPQAYAPLWQGLRNSMVLAATTVAIVLLLLAPTMVLVQLRFGGSATRKA